MGLYSVDKLIMEARRVAAEYRRATGQPLAGVSAEICKHDACHLLGLELVTASTAGHDAVGQGRQAGKRFLIKGRTIFDETKSGQRIGQFKMDQEWDSVLLVLMDDNLEPYEIYEADRDDIAEAMENGKSSNRSKRGMMSVAKFRIIGRLVWTRENGVEDDEIWDNRA